MIYFDSPTLFFFIWPRFRGQGRNHYKNYVGRFGDNKISKFTDLYPPLFFSLPALGVSDSLFVLNRLVVVGMKNFADYYYNEESEFSKAIQLSWPLMIPFRYIFYTCSEYLTVLLTLNRYIVVCQPKFSHHMESLKTTKISIGCVIFFSFLLNFPVFLKRSWGYENDEGITIKYYNIFSKDEAHTFEIVYETWIWIFFNLVLPLGCLLIFNSLLLNKVGYLIICI